MPKIARVIYNRLDEGEPLGIDATICYGPQQAVQRAARQSDLEADTPYNSRRNQGLPPTPIAAPGRAALEAALNPADGRLDLLRPRSRREPHARRAATSSPPRPGSSPRSRPSARRPASAAASDDLRPVSPISGATRLAAVIGSPVRHSLSPAIHNAAFAAAGLDWRFVALEVAPGDAAPGPRRHARARARRPLGHDARTRTTSPPLVDERSDDADAPRRRQLRRPPRRRAAPGREHRRSRVRRRPPSEPGSIPPGAACRVLGAGGAARAVVLALARAGAAEVGVVNRTPAKAERAAALAGAGRARDRPVGRRRPRRQRHLGRHGRHGRAPARRRRRCAPDHVVAELVVHPVRHPARSRRPAAAGCRTVDGVGMLVHQAAAAFEAWTGAAAPVGAMERARPELSCSDGELRLSR